MSTSIFGWRAAIFAKAARTESAEDTSHSTAKEAPPSSLATVSTLDKVRPSRMSVSPSWASRRAIARPRPMPAPVITTTLATLRSSIQAYEFIVRGAERTGPQTTHRARDPRLGYVVGFQQHRLLLFDKRAWPCRDQR